MSQNGSGKAVRRAQSKQFATEATLPKFAARPGWPKPAYSLQSIFGYHRFGLVFDFLLEVGGQAVHFGNFCVRPWQLSDTRNEGILKMVASGFVLTNSPLALVIGQVGFSLAPELRESDKRLREGFKRLGLPILEAMDGTTPVPARQIQMRFQIGPRGLVPAQSHGGTSFFFSNPEKTEGVSISPQHLAFVVNKYDTFKTFNERVRSIVERITNEFPEIYFANIGLRYLNVFLPEEIPSDWLAKSVQGIASDGIDTNHFHHKYEFWCTTTTGVLVARCTLEHGGKPPNISIGEALFPQKLVFSRDEHVYHLDIFENAKPLDPQQRLSSKNVCDYFDQQHCNIDKAFLGLVSQSGLEHFGWKVKN